MNHFFHIDILEPFEYIFAVCKVVVKVLVIDYYYIHYCTCTWVVYFFNEDDENIFSKWLILHYALEIRA